MGVVTVPARGGLVIPPGEDNRAALVFDPSELGGTLVVDDETDTPVTLELPLDV